MDQALARRHCGGAHAVDGSIVGNVLCEGQVAARGSIVCSQHSAPVGVKMTLDNR